MSPANPTHSGPAQHCPPASPPPSVSAPPRETPSAPIRAIRVIRGSLLCLLSVLALPQVAPAQEDVAETKSNLTIDTRPIVEAPITDSDRDHWSFAPIKRHSLPTTKNQSWPRTAIDAFILAKQETKNLSPAPEANRATLLRRLSFDLIGLPPTPDELARFHSDNSPDAYERQVDRLLAAPTFGERWGQYWLDLARFAESDGYEFDTVRPHAWTYRDWVIAALNADMPYDEFVRQQLAGDELPVPAEQRFTGLDERLRKLAAAATPAADPKAKSGKPKAPLPAYEQVATIFTLAGPDMPDVNDQAERRHDRLNELTGTIGSALLGLQIGCAQCHDHKYDPISQADFYRLRAVFEPALPEFKRDVPFNVLTDHKDVAPARFWIRGDHRRPGVEVQPAFPRIATSMASEHGARNSERGAEEPSATHSALRTPRSALADWLTSPNNPLTSRVIANRLWQHHFGRGLCETPSDFGVMSAPLSHPELLDWLAIELREAHWSLKRLHRLIVNSATYRQSADINSAFSIRNTELYTHFPRQRLTGEAIRDAMLAAAGLLTTERGGPGVMPPLPDELVGTLLKGQWAASQREADHYKRSVYVFARRNLRYPLFEAFDRPDGNASCAVRSRSTTAPQSLLLFNSELSLLAAQHLAGRILEWKQHAAWDKDVGWNKVASATDGPPSRDSQLPTTKSRIEQLYLLTLARRPSRDETAALEEFLARQATRLTTEARPREELALPIPCPLAIDANAAAPLVDACLAIMNTSEFIYVD